VANNSALSVQVASAGASLNMSSLTLSGGSILSLDPNTFGNPTAPMINVSGALTPASTVTIDLTTSAITNGQFTLIKYGSLGGAGFGAFALGNLAGMATLINDTTSNSIDVSISTVLTWDGMVNGNWDIGMTANWKTNAYYTQTNGMGPIVIFDDTASGNNTNITLNTKVSPAGVLVNSSTNDYSMSGTGNISGGGNLVKQGTSTLVLATTNNYSSQYNSYNTTITGGTLQLGDGATQNGSVVGTIDDNAILAVANPNGQTMTNPITGAGMFIESGPGALTLGGNNTYTGGTTINGGTLILGAPNNVSMAYTNNATLQVNVMTAGASLPMSSLTFGSSSPQLTIDMGYTINLSAPVINVSGNLAMRGNVTVNVTNVATTGTNVLLQYASRSGTGSFVAGSLPPGVTLIDNTVSNNVLLIYVPKPQAIVPTLNTNEIVVAAATPQQYGAVGDGVTDDSGAFQNAINAVYNSGGFGGGVVYVPSGNYAFYTNIVIPTGVTLHGDWTDWTTGTGGLVGTTFNVYFGAGQSNTTPFITMDASTALRNVNIWYPNQNPTNITSYPFTIELGGDSVVQNVVLVNSYQGIEVDSAEFILSTVIGTPLFMGFTTVGTIADISQTEDVRFSPAVWPASLLPNAPAAGGSYATWMRTYGTGMQVFRLDGLINVNTEISGYNLGLDFEENSGGESGCAFYNGYVTNCAIALNAQEMQTAAGLEFSDFTLDGDLAVNRTHTTNDAAVQFDDCQIIGRTGTAVYCTGANWQSAMAFQNCAISNTLNLAGPGIFNLVNCSLSGGTNCVMSASATRAAFTGCTFSPAPNIVNNGNAGNLLMDARQSISNAMPMVNWTNVTSNYVSRQPARTNLYLATSYGATGNGVADDTVAIQNALAAAGGSGGGIVYLPAGDYHLTNTLAVPSGVQLRGAYEMRHGTAPGADGIDKGAILQPYGGQGTTNGPPAVALAANAGLVGVTINYQNQWTNCFPYPPAIQGQGGNVYVIGVQCPNPYIFVDLDTYACTNHFLDMVDGWALKTGVHVGNGSWGSIVDCQANWSYWVQNSASAGSLQGAAQAPVTSFAMSNLQYYVLGDCSELFVKDFAIQENIYMHCSSENGAGPSVTGISAMCDGTYQCFVFDSTAPCTFNDVNPEWLVSLNGGYVGLTNQAILLSTANFQGTVRFFNSPIWGSHNQDYLVNGGDIGFELAHLWQFAFAGSQVNGGVFHLINAGAFNIVDGGSGSSPYGVTFGANSGMAGKTNEVIGCFSYNGLNIDNINVSNPDNAWMDYAIADYAVLDIGPVIIGDVYPDGGHQFEPSSAITFMAYSANGINSNGITLQLAATNLLGQGYVTNLTVANGLAITGSTSTRSTGAPLGTNALYTAVIKVTDMAGYKATNTVSFDTINPAYTFEAEDFDYNGGNYINNPQTGAYAGLSGTPGIDFSNGIPGQGSASYRPQGLETEGASDEPRLAYSGGLQDYDVGFANTGNWGNYTRSFPTGTYNIYMRVASPSGPTTDSASISLVTSGVGTANQTTSQLGAFSVPDTGSYQTYVWAPLKTNTTTFATFTGGSTETLRARTDQTGYNVNFYMLVTTNMLAPWVVAPAVPAGVTATAGNAQIVLNWAASPAATSYNVMRSTTSGGSYAQIAGNVAALTFTDSGLTNGTKYYYVITAVSALGTSGNSGQVSAAPVGPIILSGSSILSQGQIILAWPTNDGGAGWTPYYSPNLTPPITWMLLTNTPVLSNNQWIVTLPTGTNAIGFYRLQY